MKYQCKSCGAEIVFEAGQQALACEYCGTVNAIEAPEGTLPATFERIVPMHVTQQELEERVWAYMASGDFTPDDMLDAARVTLRERYYVAVHVFNIKYTATWSATFGFDRREPYTEYRLGPNGQREPYTAYRIVTDWQPASGTDAGEFALGAYAGKKLSASSDAAKIASQAAAQGYAQPYNPALTAGYEVETFSKGADESFRTIATTIDRHIGARVQKHAQGDRQRDWRWNAQTEYTSIPCAAPVCHAVFQYNEKNYHIWLGGHDAKTMRADPLPVDEGKKSSANMGLIPGAAGLLSMVGSSTYWDFNAASLLAVVAALMYGLMRRNALISYSKSLREALLLQRKASSSAAVNISEEERARLAQAFQRPVRPFLARTGRDAVVLPTLTALSMAGGTLPNVPPSAFASLTNSQPTHTAPAPSHSAPRW